MWELLQPDKKRVGNRVRAVKDELGASLTELGTRLGLSKSRLNSYVQGYSLAPKDVIEKLSKISGKSAEWFYYGQPSEYIADYLKLKGHGALLEEFPNIPFDIEQEFLEHRRISPGQFTTPYPDEDIIDLSFSEPYARAMNQYILRMTKEYIEQNTDCPDEQKEEVIAFIARELFDAFTAVGYFGYGDREIIEEAAAQIYNSKMKGKDLSEIDLQDQYLVGTLISLLGSDEKTAEIIRLLSKELTGKGFSATFGGEKLIAIFKSMRPALIELYTQTTSDEFYDWFER